MVQLFKTTRLLLLTWGISGANAVILFQDHGGENNSQLPISSEMTMPNERLLDKVNESLFEPSGALELQGLTAQDRQLKDLEDSHFMVDTSEHKKSNPTEPGSTHPSAIKVLQEKSVVMDAVTDFGKVGANDMVSSSDGGNVGSAPHRALRNPSLSKSSPQREVYTARTLRKDRSGLAHGQRNLDFDPLGWAFDTSVKISGKEEELEAFKQMTGIDPGQLHHTAINMVADELSDMADEVSTAVEDFFIAIAEGAKEFAQCIANKIPAPQITFGFETNPGCAGPFMRSILDCLNPGESRCDVDTRPINGKPSCAIVASITLQFGVELTVERTKENDTLSASATLTASASATVEVSTKLHLGLHFQKPLFEEMFLGLEATANIQSATFTLTAEGSAEYAAEKPLAPKKNIFRRVIMAGPVPILIEVDVQPMFWLDANVEAEGKLEVVLNAIFTAEFEVDFDVKDLEFRVNGDVSAVAHPPTFSAEGELAMSSFGRLGVRFSFSVYTYSIYADVALSVGASLNLKATSDGGCIDGSFGSSFSLDTRLSFENPLEAIESALHDACMAAMDMLGPALPALECLVGSTINTEELCEKLKFDIIDVFGPKDECGAAIAGLISDGVSKLLTGDWATIIPFLELEENFAVHGSSELCASGTQKCPLPEMESSSPSSSFDVMIEKCFGIDKLPTDSSLEGSGLECPGAPKISRNVALNKHASQSNTKDGAVAGRAVDGNTDGNYWADSVTHTGYNQGKDVWWKVDLRGVYLIEEVIVHNRMDCLSERLSNAEVKILLGDVDAAVENLGNMDGVASKTFNFVEVVGNSVKVMLPKDGVLSLAEVKVYGKPIQNVALNQLAVQRNTYDGAKAGRAVDGNTNGDYWANSVTHTGYQPYQPYWAVLLRKRYKIYAVIVYNRMDWGSERLSNAEVSVKEFSHELQHMPSETASLGNMDGVAAKMVNFHGFVGDSVFIELPVGSVLSLAEVEVYGVAVSTCQIKESGCYTISDKDECLNSQDGRAHWSGEMCAWCTEGPCLSTNSNRCEPMQHLTNHASLQASKYITGCNAV